MQNRVALEAEEDLLHCPWNPVCIGGRELLAKARFGDTAYHLLLTDMNGVWEERMDAAAIQRRAQELNKRLRAEVRAFFSHLRDVAQPCLVGGVPAEEVPAAQVSVVRQAGRHLDVRLKSELAGLPFYWEFRCTSAPMATVCSQLVRPLLLMSRLLQGQVEHMGGMLLRKDAEIQDYRENGATLTRERLQTEVFDERTYGENFIAQTLPALRSSPQAGFGLVGDLQALYGAVVGPKREEDQQEGGSTYPAAPPTQEDAEEDDHRPGGPFLGAWAAETYDGARGPSGDGWDSFPGTQQQSVLAMMDPDTSSSPSKPKKKKVKGLFR